MEKVPGFEDLFNSTTDTRCFNYEWLPEIYKVGNEKIKAIEKLIVNKYISKDKNIDSRYDIIKKLYAFITHIYEKANYNLNIDSTTNYATTESIITEINDETLITYHLRIISCLFNTYIHRQIDVYSLFNMEHIPDESCIDLISFKFNKQNFSGYHGSYQLYEKYNLSILLLTDTLKPKRLLTLNQYSTLNSYFNDMTNDDKNDQAIIADAKLVKEFNNNLNKLRTVINKLLEDLYYEFGVDNGFLYLSV